MFSKCRRHFLADRLIELQSYIKDKKERLISVRNVRMYFHENNLAFLNNLYEMAT